MPDFGSLIPYSPTAVLVGVIIYLLTHPEKAEKWGSILYRLFATISHKAEQAHIALDIQACADDFSKRINREIKDLMPYGLKIDWVKGAISPESFIKEGRVIIRLSYHTNEDENVINVVREYISKNLITNARPHISEKVSASIDFITTKKLLIQERKSALNRFYKEILDPERERDSDVKKYCDAIERIDEHGWFTRIFLRELKDLGEKMHLKNPQEEVKEESGNFLNFLGEIATKEPGEDVNTTFEGDKIQTGIVFVAKLTTESLGPHKKWIDTLIEKEFDTFYLCARGGNIELVKILMKDLESNGRVRRVTEGEGEYRLPYVYKGERKKAICVCYEVVRNGSKI